MLVCVFICLWSELRENIVDRFHEIIRVDNLGDMVKMITVLPFVIYFMIVTR